MYPGWMPGNLRQWANQHRVYACDSHPVTCPITQPRAALGPDWSAPHTEPETLK
jgi:hypothetical protein